MIPKSFEFNQKEDQIYQRWLDSKAFKPTPGKAKETFTIMMPPPNATGTLHMGHASMLAIQDIMIRFKRMQGFNVLQPFGTDDNGLPTQTLIQKLKNLLMSLM